MTSFILFFVASALRGFSELMAFHHDETIFSARVKPISFFGSKSDLMKYKVSKHTGHPEPSLNNWYYKRFDLKHKEKFPGSATIFVWVSDAFHLSNLLARVGLILAIVFAKWTPDVWNPTPVDFFLMCLKYAGLYFLGFYSTYYPLKK
jgi:hypothetical protein